MMAENEKTLLQIEGKEVSSRRGSIKLVVSRESRRFDRGVIDVVVLSSWLVPLAVDVDCWPLFRNYTVETL